MMENLAQSLQELTEKMKDVKEYVPEFLKADKPEQKKIDLDKVEVEKPFDHSGEEGLTEYQRDLLKEEYGWTDEKISSIPTWESAESLIEKGDVGIEKLIPEIKDVSEAESYYSTYDERIKQTPREDSDRGSWEGERGESKFVPTDEKIKEILDKYGLDSIEYKDGIPDFSEVSESTVEIDNMTENRAENFKQCDEKCAEQWNKEGRDGRTDWTARDVAQWRKENGYSWHERNDMKTCDLVPTEINDYFGHLGGVSECKKRDAGNNDGGDFDE